MVATKLFGSLLGVVVIGFLALTFRLTKDASANGPSDFRKGARSEVDAPRREVLFSQLAQAPFKVRELPTGYSFTYYRGQKLLPVAAEWIGIESRRCPFLDFSIAVMRDNGALVVKVAGENGVKPFLAKEFAPLLKRR